MILSDREIWMEIGSNRLVITPDPKVDQISPSALDLRLGNEFTTFQEPVQGVKTFIDTVEIDNVEAFIARYGRKQTLADNEAFPLKPGDFVLTYTLEYIRMPNYLAARVEGRSSLARLGISIHQTAPTVHATFEGQLRLEISHNGPYDCILRPGQKICQLISSDWAARRKPAWSACFSGNGKIRANPTHRKIRAIGFWVLPGAGPTIAAPPPPPSAHPELVEG